MTDRRTDERVRAWLLSRDPGQVPETLRASIASVPYEVRRSGRGGLRDAVVGLRSIRPTRTFADMHDLAKVAIAAAAVVVVAVVGMNLLSHGGVVGGPAASTTASSSPAPSASARSTSPSPAATTGAKPGLLDLTPGPFDIRWPGALIHLTLPAGWSSPVSLTSVCKPNPEPVGDCSETNGPSLAVHDVTRVATARCPSDRAGSPVEGAFVEVGPTVDDLMTALATQLGPQGSRPAILTLGGHFAQRLVLSGPSDSHASCPGPEGRLLWEDAASGGFGLLDGGTATIYVLDVDGDRVVITTHHRGASAEDIAELDAIVASMKIEPMAAELPGGSYSLIVDGVRFTVGSSPTLAGWGRYGSISVNKSIAGPQSAEAMVYWTSFPDGHHADACGVTANLPADASAADLAAAVSTAPGIELVTGPEDVTVGGRPARHVVVTVREDLGCDPGYFFSWDDRGGGPMWSATNVGDTIRVWIVEVDGTRLFIAGEIHRDLVPGQALNEAERVDLEREIQQIVDSIRFD